MSELTYWDEARVDGHDWLKMEPRPNVDVGSLLYFAGDLTVSQANYEAIMSAGCRIVVEGTMTIEPVREVVL